VRQRADKVVHGWAVEGDADITQLKANLVTAPDGRKVFAEIDRYGWFGTDEARQKLNPAQVEFVKRLIASLSDSSG